MIQSQTEVDLCNPAKPHVHFVADETPRVEVKAIALASYIQANGLTDMLTRLANEGWEVVGMNNHFAILQRPVKTVEHPVVLNTLSKTSSTWGDH